VFDILKRFRSIGEHVVRAAATCPGYAFHPCKKIHQWEPPSTPFVSLKLT